MQNCVRNIKYVNVRKSSIQGKIKISVERISFELLTFTRVNVEGKC